MALPRVPVMMSIFSSTPFTSAEPRPVAPRKPRGDLVQRRDEAVHREHAIGGDQLGLAAGGIGGLQLGFQVGHVTVGVTEALGLAQAHAVDDRSMVQRVGDDRVVLAQQRFEQATVGVEAGGIEDRVLLAEEVGDLLLQLLVQILGATDEAHRGHAEAVGIQCVLGGLDQVRMVGQAQVVVGTEVQHLAAVVEGDLGRLRAGDDPLGLEQALGADGVQFLGVVAGQGGGGVSHGVGTAQHGETADSTGQRWPSTGPGGAPPWLAHVASQ
ncbi:hypothetical protein G6F59_014379 [Rhizopus arrhizus]|nr:hypothetical protein G6F59_014379 [Rhizopus arrhizus]